MTLTLRRSLLCSHLALLGCGGGAATPLISGMVTGNYEGTMFTATNGFAAEREGKSSIIVLGTGNLNCASATAADPPMGNNGLISVASLTPGDFSNVSVQVMKNDGNWESSGSNKGTLKITAADAAKVAGTITYSDDISGRAMALNGTFEVTRCP
ncbi:MAG: hypothetical protein IT380_27295 [Myxococcales bacterium]|nr:hypothetical protein [Myxococcales bacterium]